MVTFNPNIYQQGQAQRQQSNEQLVNLFATLSGQYQKQQQLKQAGLDKKLAEAEKIKLAEQKEAGKPVNILTQKFVAQGMPLEQATLKAHDTMRSTMAVDPTTWQPMETKGSLLGAYGEPQQVSVPTDATQVVPQQPSSVEATTPLSMSPREAFEARKLQRESETRMREVEQTGDIQARRKAKTSTIEREKAAERVLPLIDKMREFNKETISTPYGGTMQPVTRLVSEKKAKASELLGQLRLRIAAPLAKQLGVTPTDKDFENTLNQIFNENASRETKEAQLNLMEDMFKGDLTPDSFLYQAEQTAKAETGGIVTLQATDKAGYESIPAGGKYIVDGVEYTKGSK